MSEELFRKKSLDKVKSPENLDDYIQVSNPGVWLLLVSVLVLLSGACVWGISGRMDSTVETSIRAENGTVVCYVADEDISSVHENTTVRFGDFEAVITEIGQKEALGYVCVLRPDQAVPNGIYEGKAVTRSVRPISFVLN